MKATLYLRAGQNLSAIFLHRLMDMYGAKKNPRSKIIFIFTKVMTLYMDLMAFWHLIKLKILFQDLLAYIRSLPLRSFTYMLLCVDDAMLPF